MTICGTFSILSMRPRREHTDSQRNCRGPVHSVGPWEFPPNRMSGITPLQRSRPKPAQPPTHWDSRRIIILLLHVYWYQRCFFKSYCRTPRGGFSSIEEYTSITGETERLSVRMGIFINTAEWYQLLGPALLTAWWISWVSGPSLGDLRWTGSDRSAGS